MINIEKFPEYSQNIKEKLNLETSPVAVKLFQKEENAKKVLEKTEEKTMHCKSIIEAGHGKSFYGTKNEIGCKFGAMDLGLTPMSEELITGNNFDNMNVTASVSSGKHLIDQVPQMPTKIEAIGYAPLEDAKYLPDVIIIVGQPRQIFDLIRANTYLLGDMIHSDFGGTQSFCGDISVKTYLTKKPNISFGCMGSHMAAGFKPDNVVIGFPIEIIDTLVESLNIVTQPPKQ